RSAAARRARATTAPAASGSDESRTSSRDAGRPHRHPSSRAQDLDSAIADLENTRRAICEGLRYWLVFGRGMTARGDRVLRLLRQVGGASTVAELAERCREALDAAEVRDALLQLVELGHVTVEGNAARLLRTGWYVGG